MRLKFKKGDFVIYKSRSRFDIGRVAGYSTYPSELGKVFYVCFHSGCTAESCAAEDLELYVVPIDSPLRMRPGIGYHRFDPMGCPDYDPRICAAYGCKPWEGETDE